MRHGREEQLSLEKPGGRAELLEENKRSVGAGNMKRVYNSNIEEVGYFANGIL